MKQNHSSPFPFISNNIISLRPAGKKRAYQNASFVCFLRKQEYHVTETLRGKQKYHVTNLGVEKIKLSRLLVQRINEFKINEILT